MSIKLIFFYLIVTTILYLEPIEVAGGLTFGIVWKLLLLLVLFLPVMYQVLKERVIEMFIFFSILLSFKILISYTSMDYFPHTITLFTKEMMFPLLYLFFIQKIEKKETLIFMTKHLSIIIILFFLPYMLGILQPFEKGYDLAEFGLEGQYGLIGPFIKPHSASITLAFAMIMITTQINRENSLIKNLFYVGLILLGLYELILTYVRTGFTIYIVVLLYLYFRNINMKKIILMILTSFAIFGAGLYMYHTNEVIKMRVDDKNKYNSSGGNGSGRFLFWKNAIDNWWNDEPSVIYIGLGYDYGREKMYEDVGMLIFAHNRFIQVLQQEGLIGFSFFFSYLFFIYRFMSRYKESQYYATTNGIFIALLVEMMFQGGFFFPLVFYLSCYLVILKKDYEEKALETKYQSSYLKRVS
jgi:hypothetical protein